MSVCIVNEFYRLDNVISVMFSEQRAVSECWPGVASNNERDQEPSQTWASKRPSVATALHPNFRCMQVQHIKFGLILLLLGARKATIS